MAAPLSPPSTTTPPAHGAGSELSLALGTLLILLGGLFLLGQMAGVWPLAWLGTAAGWPFIVIGVGLLCFVGMALGGREAGWLALPGSVVAGTGLVLLVMNATDQWQAMAYAWTLIVPTSIGVGLWLWGLRTGEVRQVRRGRRLAAVGLALFVGFAAFFELLLNLSGYFADGVAGVALPLLLIGLGALLLLRRGARGAGDATAR
jgi:hypothetical protein